MDDIHAMSSDVDDTEMTAAEVPPSPQLDPRSALEPNQILAGVSKVQGDVLTV